MTTLEDAEAAWTQLSANYTESIRDDVHTAFINAYTETVNPTEVPEDELQVLQQTFLDALEMTDTPLVTLYRDTNYGGQVTPVLLEGRYSSLELPELRTASSLKVAGFGSSYRITIFDRSRGESFVVTEDIPNLKNIRNEQYRNYNDEISLLTIRTASEAEKRSNQQEQYRQAFEEQKSKLAADEYGRWIKKLTVGEKDGVEVQRWVVHDWDLNAGEFKPRMNRKYPGTYLISQGEDILQEVQIETSGDMTRTHGGGDVDQTPGGVDYLPHRLAGWDAKKNLSYKYTVNGSTHGAYRYNSGYEVYHVQRTRGGREIVENTIHLEFRPETFAVSGIDPPTDFKGNQIDYNNPLRGYDQNYGAYTAHGTDDVAYNTVLPRGDQTDPWVVGDYNYTGEELLRIIGITAFRAVSTLGIGLVMDAIEGRNVAEHALNYSSHEAVMDTVFFVANAALGIYSGLGSIIRGKVGSTLAGTRKALQEASLRAGRGTAAARSAARSARRALRAPRSARVAPDEAVHQQTIAEVNQFLRTGDVEYDELMQSMQDLINNGPVANVSKEMSYEEVMAEAERIIFQREGPATTTTVPNLFSDILEGSEELDLKFREFLEEFQGFAEEQYATLESAAEEGAAGEGAAGEGAAGEGAAGEGAAEEGAAGEGGGDGGGDGGEGEGGEGGGDGVDETTGLLDDVEETNLTDEFGETPSENPGGTLETDPLLEGEGAGTGSVTTRSGSISGSISRRALGGAVLVAAIGVAGATNHLDGVSDATVSYDGYLESGRYEDGEKITRLDILVGEQLIADKAESSYYSMKKTTDLGGAGGYLGTSVGAEAHHLRVTTAIPDTNKNEELVSQQTSAVYICITELEGYNSNGANKPVAFLPADNDYRMVTTEHNMELFTQVYNLVREDIDDDTLVCLYGEGVGATLAYMLAVKLGRQNVKFVINRNTNNTAYMLLYKGVNVSDQSPKTVTANVPVFNLFSRVHYNQLVEAYGIWSVAQGNVYVVENNTLTSQTVRTLSRDQTTVARYVDAQIVLPPYPKLKEALQKLANSPEVTEEFKKLHASMESDAAEGYMVLAGASFLLGCAVDQLLLMGPGGAFARAGFGPVVTATNAFQNLSPIKQATFRNLIHSAQKKALIAEAAAKFANAQAYLAPIAKMMSGAVASAYGALGVSTIESKTQMAVLKLVNGKTGHMRGGLRKYITKKYASMDEMYFNPVVPFTTLKDFAQNLSESEFVSTPPTVLLDTNVFLSDQDYAELMGPTGGRTIATAALGVAAGMVATLYGNLPANTPVLGYIKIPISQVEKYRNKIILYKNT